MFEYVVCDNWSLGCQGVLVPFVQLCTMSRALVFTGTDPFVGDWATALVTGKVTGQNLPNEENWGVAEHFELLLPGRVKLIASGGCMLFLECRSPSASHSRFCSLFPCQSDALLGPQRNATGLQ